MQLIRFVSELDAARWFDLMLDGEYEAAWQISDEVLRARSGESCWHLPRHEQYFWDGQPLHGKRILIRCYHGLGDTIQFIRYVPLVAAQARQTIVWAQPALLPLIGSVPGIDLLLPLHDDEPEIDRDVDVEVMELSHLFRSTCESVPRAVPYFHVEPAALPHDQRMNIGIVWRSGEWDHRRSVPFELFRLLSEAVPARWFSLQQQVRHDERAGGISYPDAAGEMVSTARLIAGLDLLITIDSMTAHLAGALGVPVWTLLQKTADWRWMRTGDTTPWYPTMRLFRQEQAGAWEPVIEKVRGALMVSTTRR